MRMMATLHPRRARRSAAAATVLLAAALAGCSSGGGDDTSPPTTVVTPDVTELSVPRTSDGVLKIGVLLPRTGPGAILGEPLIDTVKATVQSINASGGVLGRPVRVIVRDEGADQTTAGAAVEDLVNVEKVDAIVGPGSSNVALAVAPTIVDSGVLTCSPLATTQLLTDLPDEGLFVRTIPSDTLQARAMARVIDGSGFRQVAIVFPDDLYGRDFAAALRAATEERGLTVVDEHAYETAGEDYTDVAEHVLEDDPPVVALIGDADNGSRLFSTIENTAGVDRPLFVANDSMRDADVSALLGGRGPVASLLTGVSLDPWGGADQIRPLLGVAADEPVPAFAANAVDCVNLIALAASQAGSDSPAEMAPLLQPTTRGGTSCAAVPTCQALLDQGLDIDYDGPTGLLTLDAAGDVTNGDFLQYYFDDEGQDTTRERFPVAG